MDELVERARGGDREAFGQITVGVVDRLFAIAVRVLDDRRDAEDAVQSALVDAWRDLPKLRDAQLFDSWMDRLLVRACYERGKRQPGSRGQVRELRIDPTSSDPSAKVAARDQIERAFRRLSIEQRAVIVLHHDRSMPLDEVAEVLGIGESTARSRFHKAVRLLGTSIDTDEGATIAERTLA